MGNLPRSRPGRRSEKRSGASKGATASGASGSRGGSAKKAGASSAKSGGRQASPRAAGAARREGASQAERPASGQASRAPDPVGDAVRIAAKVAGTGIGIATGILKRLPRP